VTTVAALIPTVYGIGGSSPMIKPLAMSLSYGLIFGTAITLLLLPSLYVIDQDIRRVYGKSKAKMKNTALKLLKREKSV
jgi:Cu/Ag efflux pump CusA